MYSEIKCLVTRFTELLLSISLPTVISNFNKCLVNNLQKFGSKFKKIYILVLLFYVINLKVNDIL